MIDNETAQFLIAQMKLNNHLQKTIFTVAVAAKVSGDTKVIEVLESLSDANTHVIDSFQKLVDSMKRNSGG